VRERTGRLDSAQILLEWKEWLEREIFKRKERERAKHVTMERRPHG
jgi:hypothetical protein